MASSDRRDLVRATYDQLASEYAAHLKDELLHKPMDRELLDRFADELRGAGLVCDLGCGPCHVGRYLFDRGVAVRGIDLSPSMVDEARRLHPEIESQVGDMLALDVADETFAGVVAFYAIVHFRPEDLLTAFREMRRVLRPGGRVFVAFHVGEEALHPDALWGVPVTLDWVFFPVEVVTRAMSDAGLGVTEVAVREPYEGVEHASRRAYVFGTRVDERSHAANDGSARLVT